MAVRKKGSSNEDLGFEYEETNENVYYEDDSNGGGYDEYDNDVRQEETSPLPPKSNLGIGGQLQHKSQGGRHAPSEETKQLVEKKKLTKIGENIQQKTEIRDGWIDVDKTLLGERAQFYPEDWQFRIRPATVEAIRNWSTIDDENMLSINDVFNEVLRSCLAIRTAQGPKPWNAINSWDRFFFILLVREYTFESQNPIKFESTCPNCDVDIDFYLNSQALGYDLPDPEVMQYFDVDNRVWLIDPSEYDVETDVETIRLYVPTLEREDNFKSWLMSKYQENKNFKIDNTFLKFVCWLCPKISKDTAVAKQQIRQAEVTFKNWDSEMFLFMDEVLKNVQVTPETHLKMQCPSCGEEVTAQIQFQDGIRSLFNVPSRHKKFGKK